MDNLYIIEDKYFELLLTFCLKRKNSLFISVDKICSEPAKRLLKKAKSYGINDVHIEWRDAYAETEMLKVTSLAQLKNSELLDLTVWNTFAQNDAAFLILKTEIPNIYKGIDEKKVIESNNIKKQSQKFFSTLQLSYAISWTIAVLPNNIWAEYLFPNLKTDVAYTKLYYKIFETCMIDKKVNIIEKWNKQLQYNSNLVKKLNRMTISQLHYVGKNGTDLLININKSAVWMGADKGNMIVNMPTYEVFTYPDSRSIEGIVYSTRPLVYNGIMISDFYLRFENGIVVDSFAKQGNELLKHLLSCSKGSNTIGEVALVDHYSPISKLQMIFGNTLLDENASCHFALGNAYPVSLKNYKNILAEEKFEDYGFNISDIHIDFMIGNENLSIIAKTNTDNIEIFHEGKIII